MTCHYKYNHALVPFSKVNRKKQTDAEKFLWSYLRGRQLNGFKFRRQYPIQNYILDFYCNEIKVAVELDGSQHQKRKTYDTKRSSYLQKLGIHILRFWDNDLFQNTEGVLNRILSKLEEISISEPHPDPLLRGEGEGGRRV